MDDTHVRATVGDKTYVDYDATVDTVLALRALGGQGEAMYRASHFLLSEKAVAAYVHGAPHESAEATYAEPAAKLILIASLLQREGQATDEEKATLQTLTSALTARVAADGAVSDRGKQAGPVDSTRRQAWTVLALSGAQNQERLFAVRDRLASSQCSDGRFPAAFIGQACATGDLAATGWAVSALAIRGADEPTTALPTQRKEGLLKAVRVLVAAAPQGLVAVDGATDQTASSAVLAARQVVGLDNSAAGRTVAATVRADGGIATHGSDQADPVKTLAAATAVAGRTWLTTPASPVTPAEPLVGPLPDGSTSATGSATAAVASTAPGSWRDWAVPMSVAMTASALLIAASLLLPRLRARRPADGVTTSATVAGHG